MMHAGSALPTLEGLLAFEDADFVRAAYRLLLGREVDADGLGNYLEQLADGLSREEMLASLALSREGRIQAAAAKRGDPDTILRERLFAFAAPTAETLEALLAHRDAGFVHCAYQALLGRDADATGVREYLERLREGASQWRILDSLQGSSEYAAREAARRAVREGALDAVQREGALADLLARPDGDFAIGANLLMTGRKPAPVELTGQLERLRSGLARPAFLGELARSDGANESRVLLERLESALRWHRRTRWPLVGRWIAALLGLEGESRAERRLRRIESELHRVSAGAGNTAPPAPRPEAAALPEASAHDAGVVLKPHASVAPRLVTLASTVGGRSPERAAP